MVPILACFFDWSLGHTMQFLNSKYALYAILRANFYARMKRAEWNFICVLQSCYKLLQLKLICHVGQSNITKFYDGPCCKRSQVQNHRVWQGFKVQRSFWIIMITKGTSTNTYFFTEDFNAWFQCPRLWWSPCVLHFYNRVLKRSHCITTLAMGVIILCIELTAVREAAYTSTCLMIWFDFISIM